MVLNGNIITREQVPNMFFSSYEGKYNIMDNLDEEESEPFIPAFDKIYNLDYVSVTVVLRGTLNIVIGGTDLEIKANDFLNVTPCMSIQVKDSNCQLFSFLTCSYIMAEIYKMTDLEKELHFHAFKFRHIHLTPEAVSQIKECYLRIKQEHLRPDYPMKEQVLRAYQGAYLAKFFSFMLPDGLVNHAKNTRQYKFFNEFLHRLHADYRKERSVQYYADVMHITPKYLSAIAQSYTGLTASQVIDQYVIYSIKQLLYTNERNIKAISSEFNFPSQSFFGRYFKRITGMAPIEYIKQHNIKSINFAQSQQE